MSNSKEKTMIISKQYLSKMIQEEMQTVFVEKEIKLFFENTVLPYLKKQKKLLNEQQQELLEEGIAELFSGIKSAVSKGWKGVQALFASFIRIVSALPAAGAIATSATAALGYALTKTKEGHEFVSSSQEAINLAMKASAEGTSETQKVLNVGAEFLQTLGMDIDSFDPQAVITKTNELLANMDTIVDTLMAIPGEYYVFYAIAPLGLFAIWKIIKAAFNRYRNGGEKDVEVPSTKVPSTKKPSAEKRLAAIKAERARI